MSKKCLMCDSDNSDDARFCEECGEEMNNSKTDVKGVISNLKVWWDERSMKGKGVTLCCLGILIISLIGAMGSPDHTNSTNTSPTSVNDSNTSAPVSADTPPKEVTIGQLYAHSVPEGTLVKVTGTVLQSDEGSLRIENSDGKDIYITGSDLHAYEDHKVTVVGTYKGPESYTTVHGASRTVPWVEGAKLV